MEKISDIRPRLTALEPFRALAFFGVVSQHVLGAYIRRPEVTQVEAAVLGFLFALVKFAVPAFIFISGAALFYSHYGRLRYGSFLKKRFFSVVLPYLIWAVIYYFYIPILRGGAFPCGKAEYILRVLTGEVKYHTWYVFLIIQFYLLLPLIFRLYDVLERYARRGRGATTLVFCGFGAAYTLLLVFSKFTVDVPVLGALLFLFRGKNFLFYLPYFLLGGAFARNESVIRAWLHRMLVPILAVCTASYAAICMVHVRTVRDGARSFDSMGSLNIRFFIFTVTAVCVLYLACAVLSRSAHIMRLSVLSSRHSYSAYLAHALVLDCCAWTLTDFFPNLPLSAFYAVLLTSVILLSLLAGAVFDRLYGLFRRPR